MSHGSSPAWPAASKAWEGQNPLCLGEQGVPGRVGGSTSTPLTPPGACAADVWEQLCTSVGIFSSAATIESSF